MAIGLGTTIIGRKIDQARRKFFSSDVAGKKEDRIRDYSELNQIICPGLCNLIYPAILHENYDLLAKRRRNRFIIPLQLSQECENELMPCSDRSEPDNFSILTQGTSILTQGTSILS